MKRLLVFVFALTLLGSCGKKGCTDPIADNYDEDATKDDGSCEYPDTTYIPDPNFEQVLINLGLDNVIDGKVLTSNIDTVTVLDVNEQSISVLTGIKNFTALETLFCEGNQLTSLDVSSNTALTYLWCTENQLTSLDVSGCTALTWLNCVYNSLTSLDVSQNSALTYLFCNYNQLTSLDVSSNTALQDLSLDYNYLNCLNVKNGNNTNLTWFFAYGNPYLSCVEVDDPNWAAQNWTNVDPGVIFSTNCNYPAGCF